MNLTGQQLEYLQHAIGADKYGRRTSDRNFFGTEKESRDGAVCESLVAMGLMLSHGPVAMYGGEHVYSATREGIAAVCEQSPSPPKVSRGQRRYQSYRDADSGLTFREWLKGRMYAR